MKTLFSTLGDFANLSEYRKSVKKECKRCTVPYLTNEEYAEYMKTEEYINNPEHRYEVIAEQRLNHLIRLCCIDISSFASAWCIDLDDDVLIPGCIYNARERFLFYNGNEYPRTYLFRMEMYEGSVSTIHADARFLTLRKREVKALLVYSLVYFNISPLKDGDTYYMRRRNQLVSGLLEHYLGKYWEDKLELLYEEYLHPDSRI